MKKHLLKSLSAIIMFIFFFALTSAATDQVVSNSANWQDVYSTVLYGNLIGADAKFLTSTPHGPILLFEIPKSREGIQIITSADKPLYIGYESLFRSKGYTAVEELIYRNINLELAKRLPDVNKFIVIDDAYGYNAIAIAPYATKAGFYVLFANTRTISEVSDFLSTKNIEKMIIYGQVNRNVKTALARYNPEILNSESGSRFENNVLIVDKYSEISSTDQVILSNGEFIEASMMSGKEPVLFIGKNNVPQEIKDYIKEKNIKVGVLIGNELIGSATDIRRQLGISVFVKFARGSRIPGGTINPVEDLDRFPMPSYQLSLSIVSITYNKATGLLEVTYKNNVDLASFFKTTVTLKGNNAETLSVVGDNATVFIDGGETKTVVYKVDAAAIPNSGNLTGEVYTIYGESKTSLENVLRGTFKVETINIMDDANIEITGLKYDKSTGKWYVTIENTGTVDAYVGAELFDIWVNGEYVSVGADSIEKISPGKKKDIIIKLKLEDEDLTDEKNADIDVRVNYGERQHALIKNKTKSFKLEYRTSGGNFIIVLAVIVIIILFLLLFRRRKRCQRCRTLNDRNAKHCKKCGQEL